TITAGVSGGLVSVRVAPYCVTTAQDVTLEVRGTTSGLPNATVFASKTMNVTVPTGTPVLVEYAFDAPVYFAKDALYSIVLSAIDDPLQCGVADGPDGDSYTGGNAYV